MPEKKFKLLDRDVATLRHMLRYLVGLLATVSEAVFDGREPGRPLSFLTRDKFIERHTRSLENNVTYFTPTAEAYRALGRKVNSRATTAKSQPALDSAIAIACACTLGAHKRHRITREELVDMIGNEADAPPNNIFHLITQELGWPTILRVVFANSVGRVAIEKLERHAREIKRNATLAPWLTAGDYGFVVLVPWRNKVTEIRALIAASAVSKDCVVVADVGPDTRTISRFLKERKGKSNGK